MAPCQKQYGVAGAREVADGGLREHGRRDGRDGGGFAYSEGQQNGRLIAHAKEISLLQQRYAKLRSQALTPEDSVGLLKRLRGAL